MDNKLQGADLEYANKFLNNFGDVLLNEMISNAQIILSDLKMGALHANNFHAYLNKQSDCGKFLLGIIVDNMASNIEDLTKGAPDAK